MSVEIGKYFGKMGILQVSKEEAIICICLLGAFAGILLIPIVMAVMVYMFFGLFITTPSYVVGGGDEDGAINSKFYYAVVVAYWAGISVAIEGNMFVIGMVFVPLIGIASALRSLRYESLQHTCHGLYRALRSL